MKIFKDILTGAEVVCDNDKPFAIEGDIAYVVQGRYIEIGGEDYGISANVDDDAGEGATGDVDNSKQRVIDIVHNNRYTETNYDKNSYMAHIRNYMKKLLENIANEDEKKAFQTNAAAYVKKVLKDIDEYQFFIPEGNEEDPDNGMIALCKWDGEVPSFYYWKDGLKGERV